MMLHLEYTRQDYSSGQCEAVDRLTIIRLEPPQHKHSGRNPEQNSLCCTYSEVRILAWGLILESYGEINCYL